jgi:hypothetical protein
MEFDYDAVIIGGAFSGAATALMEEVVSCYWPQWFAFTPLS